MSGRHFQFGFTKLWPRQLFDYLNDYTKPDVVAYGMGVTQIKVYSFIHYLSYFNFYAGFFFWYHHNCLPMYTINFWNQVIVWGLELSQSSGYNVWIITRNSLNVTPMKQYILGGWVPWIADRRIHCRILLQCVVNVNDGRGWYWRKMCSSKLNCFVK